MTRGSLYTTEEKVGLAIASILFITFWIGFPIMLVISTKHEHKMAQQCKDKGGQYISGRISPGPICVSKASVIVIE